MESRIMQPAIFIPSIMGAGPLGERPLATPLYIGNLDENVYEEQLFGHFSKYGPIHSLKIVKDNPTNRSRGFGYINFINPKDAENARLLSQYEKIGKLPVRIMYKRNTRDQEGNIFVRNIDPTVTHKELHSRFTQHGNVLTVKIATNQKGESLGYGYVQMNTKEEAETAIKALNLTRLKEKEITCEHFVPRAQRPHSSHTNIYVRGLPRHFRKDQKEDVEQLVYNKFSEFGKINSHVAQYSEKNDAWFAYVSFEDTKSAEDAIDKLNDKPIFGDENLYVAWHQSKYVRYAELKRQFSNTKNDNNLFIKNLKPDVTYEKVKKAFSQFGEVTSVAVKKIELKPNDIRGSGFVAFKVSQDAQKAQSDGHRFEGIRELFIENQESYISFWQPKSVRDQFKASKQRIPFHLRRMPGFDQLPGAGMFPVLPFPPRFMPYQLPMINPSFGRPRPYQPYQPYPGRYQNPNQRRGYYGRPQQSEYRAQGGGRSGYGRQYTNQAPRENYQQRTYQPHGNAPTHQQGTTKQAQPRENVKETNQNPASVLDASQNLTVQNLKYKLDDFLKLDSDKQRNILGELLYPKIVEHSGNQYAPKITGMLVDFDVLTVQDILEMLEDDQILEERIQEAKELIVSEGKN